MNNEFKIISRKPLTFWAHVIIGGGAVLVPMLDQYNSTPLSEISLVSWVKIALSTLIAVANTIKAWFSTSSQKAREEIKE